MVWRSSLDHQMCFSEGSEKRESNAETALSFYTKGICSCWASALGESTPQTMLKSFSTDLTHRKSMHLRKKTHKRVKASWWTLASVRSAVYLKQAAPENSWIRTLMFTLNCWLKQVTVTVVRAKSSCWTSYGQMKSKLQCNQLQSLWPVHIVHFPHKDELWKQKEMSASEGLKQELCSS